MTEVATQKSKAEFMRGEGAMLYGAVNARMLASVARTAIRPVTTESDAFVDVADYAWEDWLSIRYHDEGDMDVRKNPAIPLYLVAKNLIQHDIFTSELHDFYNRFGVRPEDLEASDIEGIYRHGFDDRGFAWTFSAGLANAVAFKLLEQGKISKSRFNAATLTDWAGMVGSKWFAKLTHDLAFVRNGFLGSFGESVAQYTPDYFDRRFARLAALEEREVVLVVNNNSDVQEEGMPYTVTLNPNFRARIRRGMHNSQSVGCPAARRVVRLPRNVVHESPHVQELISRNIAEISGDPDSSRLQVEQRITPIERTLTLVTKQLRKYDELYGTPKLRFKGVKGERKVRLEHVQRPPSRVFVDPTPLHTRSTKKAEVVNG